MANTPPQRNLAGMIRWANPAEYDALGRVMYDAIRQGRSPYTPAQRRAWLPAPNAGPGWAARLAAQRVAVAEGLTGFMTLDDFGQIDLAFILPGARGKGLFRALLGALEFVATTPRLTTHASLAAIGPFAAMGFSELRRESVVRAGETLGRALMEKQLNADR